MHVAQYQIRQILSNLFDFFFRLNFSLSHYAAINLSILPALAGSRLCLSVIGASQAGTCAPMRASGEFAQYFMACSPQHLYYPNLPPGVSPKFHIFWKTFTVIEMVGRVNVKASQHTKKSLVVHIDRVLDFDASGSEKEQTENIH
jgi:hypothetical protein